jgi:hypothetical protein
MLTAKRFTAFIVGVWFGAVAGCSSSTPSGHAGQTDAGSATVDAQPRPPSAPRRALGTECSADVDCTSGFCTDGVCCDSACTETCYACNQAAAVGHCGALASGQDSNATVTCALPSACYQPTSANVPVCKLVDGTVCDTDGECVSGHCLTFYADADGDGFGGPDGTRFCSELNGAPPTGFAAYTGDCCDLDAGANPGFDSTQFLAMPDACGSFDWNCDGKQAQQRSCPAVVPCGAACNVNLGFFSYTAFTEACN